MSQKPKTILIVDDDEGMRDTLSAILKREYRILRVASGEAALPILNREDVDLMLLDVRLPGISGFEVLRIVKENYSLIEVLMISAINDIETAVQARSTAPTTTSRRISTTTSCDRWCATPPSARISTARC
jgi:DNA-binding NtrC family response regulator